MSFQAQPTVAGTYLVKQYNSNNYWKYISSGARSIQLDSLDENSDLFKVFTFVTLHVSDSLLIGIYQWNLAPVSGNSNLFTIRPASETTVDFSKSVDNKDNYGFAEGHVSPSDTNWRFTTSSHGKYSRYGFSMFVT
jgi:hypothetical protein